MWVCIIKCLHVCLRLLFLIWVHRVYKDRETKIYSLLPMLYDCFVSEYGNCFKNKVCCDFPSQGLSFSLIPSDTVGEVKMVNSHLSHILHLVRTCHGMVSLGVTVLLNIFWWKLQKSTLSSDMPRRALLFFFFNIFFENRRKVTALCCYTEILCDNIVQ